MSTDLLSSVKRKIAAEGLSLRKASNASKVSYSTLSRLLRGVGEPTALTTRRLEAWVMWESIEAERDRYKKALEDIYEYLGNPTLNGPTMLNIAEQALKEAEDE